MVHPLDSHPHRGLFTPAAARSRRASSWDRSGANNDYAQVAAGETATLLDHRGPGCITHCYFALAFPEVTDYRDAIIRMYWDDEPTPSVEVPLGEFFGIMHARIRALDSQFLAVHPGMGASHGLNNYFPMPFGSRALITLENRADGPLGGMLPACWYQIDYEVYTQPPRPDVLRFHAHWRQEKPTTAVPDPPGAPHGGINVDGAQNYVVVDASGTGQMVGLILEVNNVAGGWYGEGDDMVFIDGDEWPPAIHGTGTEEIFGAGACPITAYAGRQTGIPLIESPTYEGLHGMYRWFTHDPIRFASSLRWTIEHGHANNLSNEYASVAFWYQTEPHGAFPALPERDDMRPPLDPPYERAREAFLAYVPDARAASFSSPEARSRFGAICEAFYAGRWQRTLDMISEASRS